MPIQRVNVVISVIALLLDIVCGQGCPRVDYILKQNTENVLTLNSPNYPGAYPKGTSCQYRVTAPIDQYASLSCRFEVFPNQCLTEYFFVSGEGDLSFRNTSNYCYTADIEVTSLLRSISFMYKSGSSTTHLQGRFSCRAQTVKHCQCGRSFVRRITHGDEAKTNAYPYMVAIRNVIPPQSFLCGATIISHRHLLTAAHCILHNPDPKTIIAHVGVHDLTRPNDSPYAVQHRIQQIFMHPSYRTAGDLVFNDIALLLTQQPIKWSFGVGPICLPIRQRNDFFTNQLVDVIGWGTRSFGGILSNTLQRIQLTVLENNVCRQRFNAMIEDQQHLCTSDLVGTRKGSCQFDSGGPVISFQNGQAFLVGVISFGPGCGLDPVIGVSARITSQIDWLLKYVLGHVCAA